MRKTRRVAAAVAMIAAGAALAGCGSSSSSPGYGSPTTGGPSNSTASDATPTQAALLTAGDLPSGLQIKPLDISQVLQQNSKLTKGMQVSPPECQSIMTAALGNAANFQGVSMIATRTATDPTQFAAITEMVLKKTPALDIATLRANLQKCGNATVTMGSTKAASSTREIPLSGVHADQSLGMTQQVKVSGAPSSVPAAQTTTQMALMVIGNRVVSVSMAGSPGGITLTDLANKAVAKAQNS